MWAFGFGDPSSTSCYHIYIVVGLLWCSIWIFSLFSELDILMGYNMDHYYSMIHSESSFSSRCRVFPCQDWDLLVHWDDFNDDLVHSSKAAEMVHNSQMGISVRNIYMARSRILLLGRILLWSILTPLTCYVMMIMVTYAYIICSIDDWLVLRFKND